MIQLFVLQILLHGFRQVDGKADIILVDKCGTVKLGEAGKKNNNGRRHTRIHKRMLHSSLTKKEKHGRSEQRETNYFGAATPGFIQSELAMIFSLSMLQVNELPYMLEGV